MLLLMADFFQNHTNTFHYGVFALTLCYPIQFVISVMKNNTDTYEAGTSSEILPTERLLVILYRFH